LAVAGQFSPPPDPAEAHQSNRELYEQVLAYDNPDIPWKDVKLGEQ
jgi:hypothetical protein